MAASDLLAELGREPAPRLDADLEKRVASAALTQLDDASGDVSGLAVKWCGGGARAARAGARGRRAGFRVWAERSGRVECVFCLPR